MSLHFTVIFKMGPYFKQTIKESPRVGSIIGLLQELQVALQNATFPSKIRVKYTVFGLKRARSGESLGQ